MHDINVPLKIDPAEAPGADEPVPVTSAGLGGNG
jgi:hypothetical protein